MNVVVRGYSLKTTVSLATSSTGASEPKTTVAVSLPEGSSPTRVSLKGPVLLLVNMSLTVDHVALAVDLDDR